MINQAQFRALIIQNSLKPLSLYSEGAEQLLMATASMESQLGTYIKQKGGPAMGPYQMEPLTFRDNWSWVQDSKHYDGIMTFCNFKLNPGPEEMITNLKFATIVARVHYLKFPEKIPEANNFEAIWAFYKKRWNTNLGDTTRTEFLAAYQTIGMVA